MKSLAKCDIILCGYPMRLQVKVTPNAKHTQILGVKNDILQIHITTSPDKGKANAVVIELLAEHYGENKKNIQIVSGHTTRLKWIEVITIA
jgi:hypothetical protein